MRKIIVYATCQGVPFRDFLLLSNDISNNYEVEYISNFSSPGKANLSISDDSLSSCDVFIYHPTKDLDIEVIKRKLPKLAKVLKIPYVTFSSYWPDFSIIADKPLGKSEEYPYGKIPYRSFMLDEIASGDGLISEAIDEYLGLGDAISNACSLRLIKDLDYLKKMDELEGPFLIKEYIEDNYKRKRLFHIFNHPKNEIYFILANQFLEFMGYEMLDGSSLCKVNGHLMQELPIHPATVNFLGLTFCDDNTRYRYLGDEYTYKSFVEQYLGFVNDEE
ncbi:WcbI family polysaccharide biosynthesis putative acetyltransferase [Agarivorans sp. MS3-6]